MIQDADRPERIRLRKKLWIVAFLKICFGCITRTNGANHAIDVGFESTLAAYPGSRDRRPCAPIVFT